MTIRFFGITGWGFRATANIHSHPETVDLKGKDLESFREFVEELIENKSRFYTPPTLFNGTLQTLAVAAKSFDTPHKTVYYGRRIMKFKDGGSCSMDYVIPKPETEAEKADFEKKSQENLPEGWPRQNKGTRFLTKEEVESKVKGDPSDESKVLIICHGLAGGLHEPWVRDLILNLHKAQTEFAEVVVLNCRGCSRTKLSTPELFCGFSTHDIREVVEEINQKYPKRGIFLVGYSFGSMSVLNYLAEEGKEFKDHNIQLAVSVSCPFDLTACNDHLKNTYSGIYYFEPALVSFLTRLVKNNRKELEPLKEKYLDLDLSDEYLKSIKHMADFDDAFTAKMYNFNSSLEYYRKCSPVNRMSNIRVPTVLVNALDDPCVSNHLPLREISSNPFLVQVTTDLGGHLAFIDHKGESWVNKKIAEIFKKFEDKGFGEVDSRGWESKKNAFGA